MLSNPKNDSILYIFQAYEASTNSMEKRKGFPCSTNLTPQCIRNVYTSPTQPGAKRSMPWLGVAKNMVSPRIIFSLRM